MLLYTYDKMPSQKSTFNKNNLVVFYGNKLTNFICDRMCVGNLFYYFLFTQNPKAEDLGLLLLQSFSRFGTIDMLEFLVQVI